jgi:hypothetical protein
LVFDALIVKPLDSNYFDISFISIWKLFKSFSEKILLTIAVSSVNSNGLLYFKTRGKFLANILYYIILYYIGDKTPPCNTPDITS